MRPGGIPHHFFPQLALDIRRSPISSDPFQARYRKELDNKQDSLNVLRQQSKEYTVTLLYGARDELHNEALALKTIIDRVGELLEHDMADMLAKQTTDAPRKPWEAITCRFWAWARALVRQWS